MLFATIYLTVDCVNMRKEHEQPVISIHNVLRDTLRASVNTKLPIINYILIWKNITKQNTKIVSYC